MKKLFTIISCLILLAINSNAQNVSLCTGLNSSGSNAPNGSIDANWKVSAVASSVAGTGASTNSTFVVPNYTIGSTIYWQPSPAQGTCCRSGWINPTAAVGGQAHGFYSFERVIPVPSGIKQIDFSFKLAYDDDLGSLEIESPTGAITNLTSSVVRSTSPTAYYLSNEIKQSFSCPTIPNLAGNWKLRVKVRYVDALGALMVNGCVNLIQGTCSCCDSAFNNSNIQGEKQLKCDFKEAKFCFTNCKDAKYDWSVISASGSTITSFTGQGTNCIVLNNLKGIFCEGVYKIVLRITCNGKTIEKTFSFNVAGVSNCVPNFLLSSTETSNTNFTITGIPSSSTTGLAHAFVIEETSSCGTKPTSFIGFNYYNTSGTVYNSSGISTAGSSSNGISASLVKGKCYTVTHYIKCCCKWKCIKKCICFSNLHCDNTMKSLSTSQADNGVDVDFKDLPTEIQNEENKN